MRDWYTNIYVFIYRYLKYLWLYRDFQGVLCKLCQIVNLLYTKKILGSCTHAVIDHYLKYLYVISKYWRELKKITFTEDIKPIRAPFFNTIDIGGSCYEIN